MPVKQPQDHKQKAAKAEVQRKDVTFTFDDVEYTITRENADNLELMEFVEDEKYVKAIRGFIGNKQWDTFKDSQRDESGRVPMASFEGLLNAVMEAVGGNSSASPTS